MGVKCHNKCVATSLLYSIFDKKGMVRITRDKELDINLLLLGMPDYGRIFSVKE